MQVTKIKSRHVLFTSCSNSSWDTNMQLILGDKNNYLVDTGWGSDGLAEVKAYIKENSKPLVVINTHFHCDHTWGNGYTDGELRIAHSLCGKMLEENWDEMLDNCSMYIHGQTIMALPNMVFDSQLYFPEDGIRLIYTPGHTIDSISILDEKEKVINVGDNIGDTEEDIVPNIYSDMSCYRQTLLKYKELDFDTCLSGHNKAIGKDIVDKILDLI